MATGDELARTATAGPAASGPRTPADPLGATLGRYRLEHMLGEGGMGVVHAAFDPDLERRVALKVLRSAHAADEARQRLLREARAMARLTHANVVTVHEVGTVGDRDYVAMELIDGSTLADWLTVKPPRSADEITAAFVAAGRGLAAAHAAGLVHRDFKPHNVLRRRDGRIVVTDFGLARGVDDAPAIALEETLPISSTSASSTTPSTLSGLTRTGSVLGTPAYMAPEQWSGGAVGPAADQFAFCVALWEALTGERPYRGKTLDALKAEVKRGPADVDGSKLPRGLRRPLRRGLDPDPARRWPSMNALLAAIERRPRSHFVLGLVGSIAAAIAVAVFVLGGGAEPAACEPPALEPDAVWSPFLAGAEPAAVRDVFASQLASWKTARATACTADITVRSAQLHCLDGVLARFSALRQSALASKLEGEDVLASLVDPSACLVPAPPRLAMRDSSDVVAALELGAKAPDDESPAPELAKEAQAFADRPGLDPCARTIALVAVERAAADEGTKRASMVEAVAAAEQCDDDRVRAQTLIGAMPYQFEVPVIGPRGIAAIRRADVAARRMGQPSLTARIDFMRGVVAMEQDQWQDGFDLLDSAVRALDAAGLHRHALQYATEEIEFRFNRSRAEDLAAVRAAVATWKPVAERLHADRLRIALEHDDALVRWSLGDVATAHADLVRLWHPSARIDGGKLAIDGEVVDRGGKPVAGATVEVSRNLTADSIGIPFPVGRLHFGDGDMRVATTDAAGHFAFAEAPDSGALMAQLGELRSIAALVDRHVRLVLAPTHRLSGKVKLGALSYTQVTISVSDRTDHARRSALVAPVAPDGSFSLDGAPTTALRIAAAIESPQYETQLKYQDVAASTEPVGGIELDLAATGRTLDVVARSTLTTPLDAAQIAIVPGKIQFANVGAFIQHASSDMLVKYASHVIGEAVPTAAADKVKRGDLTAHFSGVPAGDVTVCVIGLAGDMMDQEMMHKIQAHISELDLRCETIGGDAKVVEIAAPPQKRFD